jgi:hypothetical protein
MTTVTLSRGTTSVEIPLLESGGSPLFSTDFGKPFANLHTSSGCQPQSARPVEQSNQSYNHWSVHK